MKQTTPTETRTSGATSYLMRTQSFLRTQLWIWPLLAAAVLAFVGVWLRLKMESAMKQTIAGTLQTILNANTEALRAWSVAMKSDVENLAEDGRVREFVAGLLQRAEPGAVSQAALLAAPQLATLRAYLNPWLERRGFSGFVVLDTNALVVASARDQLVGLKSPPGYVEEYRPCLAGKSLITRPFPSIALLPDEKGNLRTGVPTMFAAAPIRSVDGRVIAALGLRIAPEKDFTRILGTARAGESGETYAFDRKGLLLSESRFADELKRLGLVPDTPDTRSVLTLELRDPLANLHQGRPSPKRRAEQPFTTAVAAAMAGGAGVNVEGYRDYRGVPSVGAWRWLPEFELGLVTEMDEAEALAPLRILRWGFGSLFALLVLGAVLVFVLMRLANRLQSAARTAALKAKQLGQYALDDKIGAGACGTVYRGHHALMRRPVAVKLLDPAKADDSSIARFEREVQLTCQLTHPNTIALYDYGRTPEGIFYYAMEYLEGLSLEQLVKQYGRQPEGRVIHILRQVCGSLAEAHGRGLIHRDIKPHNIFLTQRGGVPDFVKVLDFGLVKALNQAGQVELTASNATLGTPLYMSPEAVEHPDAVDARSDLYSLGAVGYQLLTGETVFCGLSIGEVLMQQVKAAPEKPSARMRQPVSPDLEHLLMQCLEKSPPNRPRGARELDSALAGCRSAANWNCDQADDWWRKLAAARSEKTVQCASR